MGIKLIAVSFHNISKVPLINSKYETGELMPTTDNLIILAKFYNTSLDYLMDLTDEQTPYPAKTKQ